MKKVLVIGLAAVLLAGCGSKEKNNDIEDKEYVSIMEYESYSEIEMNNIASIEKLRYTEGGMSNEEITDAKSIEVIYKNLVKQKVGEKVETACEDNTTVYVFKMNNGKEYSIEIECDWFVINNKRYKIVK